MPSARQRSRRRCIRPRPAPARARTNSWRRWVRTCTASRPTTPATSGGGTKTRAWTWRKSWATASTSGWNACWTAWKCGSTGRNARANTTPAVAGRRTDSPHPDLHHVCDPGGRDGRPKLQTAHQRVPATEWPNQFDHQGTKGVIIDTYAAIASLVAANDQINSGDDWDSEATEDDQVKAPRGLPSAAADLHRSEEL